MNKRISFVFAVLCLLNGCSAKLGDQLTQEATDKSATQKIEDAMKTAAELQKEGGRDPIKYDQEFTERMKQKGY